MQSQKNKNIIYVSYHRKQQTMQILKILGYDVSLNLIDENKIDGKRTSKLEYRISMMMKKRLKL